MPAVSPTAAASDSPAVAALDNFRCLRTATHKYIHNHNDRHELYDLEADPDELHNIAAEQPELATDLARRLRRRLT